MFKTIEMNTGFKEYDSLTADVEELVKNSGVQNGFCVVSVPHTTAGLCITSFWDPRGLADLADEIDRNFPARVSYKHQESPYDASGHVRSTFISSSTMLLICDGKLILGSSQGLVFLEFDGPRPRKYHVVIVERTVNLSKYGIDTKYMGMHDITENVQKAIVDTGVRDGICHVSVLHSTAGLLVCNRDTNALMDIMSDIERMVPTRVDFKHRETASDAGGHVKTALTGSQLSFAVVNGKLALAEDQAVVFAEFDGPRPRNYFVGIIPD